MHFGVNGFILFSESPRIGPYGRVVVVGVKNVIHELPLELQKDIERVMAATCAERSS